MANEDRLDRIERSLEQIVTLMGRQAGTIPPGAPIAPEEILSQKNVQDAANKFLTNLDLDSAQNYISELNKVLPKDGGPVGTVTVTVTITITITITIKTRPPEA